MYKTTIEKNNRTELFVEAKNTQLKHTLGQKKSSARKKKKKVNRNDEYERTRIKEKKKCGIKMKSHEWNWFQNVLIILIGY